jgi:uncharacterized Zn-binding protein involved in type VI secretion
MAAAARVDVDTVLTDINHKCDVTPKISVNKTTLKSLNDNVTINGALAAVAGDSLETHNIEASGICVPHVTPPFSGAAGEQKQVNTGSSRVTIGGFPAARVGDIADDTGVIQTGSSNVSIG